MVKIRVIWEPKGIKEARGQHTNEILQRRGDERTNRGGINRERETERKIKALRSLEG